MCIISRRRYRGYLGYLGEWWGFLRFEGFGDKGVEGLGFHTLRFRFNALGFIVANTGESKRSATAKYMATGLYIEVFKDCTHG